MTCPTKPNAAARRSAQGEYIDPLTNQRVVTDEILAADHIFPKKEIKLLPGFDKLTRDQQSDVLNLLDNIQGLSKSANSSKGSKLSENWSSVKGKPASKAYQQKLAAKQEEMRSVLQGMIDGFLGL